MSAPKIDLNTLLQLKAQGYSRPKPAAYFNVSLSTLNRFLKENGIKPSSDEAFAARSKASQKKSSDPAVLTKIRESNLRAYSKSEVRERQAEGMRQAWFGEYGESHRELMASSYYRTKQSKVSPCETISAQVKGHFWYPDFPSKFDAMIQYTRKCCTIRPLKCLKLKLTTLQMVDSSRYMAEIS